MPASACFVSFLFLFSAGIDKSVRPLSGTLYKAMPALARIARTGRRQCSAMQPVMTPSWHPAITEKRSACTATPPASYPVGRQQYPAKHSPAMVYAASTASHCSRTVRHRGKSACQKGKPTVYRRCGLPCGSPRQYRLLCRNLDQVAGNHTVTLVVEWATQEGLQWPIITLTGIMMMKRMMR